MSDLTTEILQRADRIRFHTPGHDTEIGKSLCKCDVTELPYTDNLLSPVSALRQLEKELASAYKAEACFISTQGATHNILQAVYAVKDEGAFLIVGAAHASVYNAMRAFSLRAYHVDAFSEDTPIPADVKNVFFTSPDYFGHCLPLERIYPALRAKGLNVLVDSAHGAHFTFSSKLPVSASEYADLAILSMHKTLPVLTGGSVLCCKRKFADKCVLCRKTFHTTSPSFLTMCSMEQALKELVARGEESYDAVLSAVETFKKKLPKPYEAEENDDPTRLVLVSPYDGEALYHAIAEKGYVGEMYFENKVVFIVHPYNARYLNGLSEAVSGIGDLPLYDPVVFPRKAHPYPTPMEFGGVAEAVPLSEAEGRKVFLEVGFYPPGVPLLYSHDVFTKEHIAFLTDESAQKKVFGLENGKVYVVQ